MTAAPPQTPEAAGLEYYGYRVFNAGIGVCWLVAKPGPNDTNPEPLVTAASAQAAIDAEKARANRAESRIAELATLFGVCDGGRYLNDWRARADRAAAAEARADRLAQQVLSLGGTPMA